MHRPSIDDGSERRLASDFAYYPPVPQARALDWTGARTVPRIGWEWALLGLNPHLTPARAPATARPTLLVAMGGSDPQGLTCAPPGRLPAGSDVSRPLCHRRRHGERGEAWPQAVAD